MIVDSMTHEEVYQELERDRDTLTRWWQHQKDTLRRRLLKARQFPVNLWYEYTSPRKNHYTLYTRIFDKRGKAMLTGICAMRHTQEGLTGYTTWIEGQKLISPMVLTPHMWKRYAERCGVEKSGAELIRHYFTHNSYGQDTRNQQIVGRSVRYNGEQHMCCCVNDGVLLGQEQGRLFVARTFITYDMCSGLQEQEFEECRKQILTDNLLYEHARNYYQNR